MKFVAKWSYAVTLWLNISRENCQTGISFMSDTAKTLHDDFIGCEETLQTDCLSTKPVYEPNVGD